MDLVSVIVPVYMVEPYLRRCVESIRRQTYGNLEIILVDDGSTDGCGQMCDDYARIDKRIKVVHKENGGLGYARNSGLEVITGAYVTFIDSDDWISETHIEILYREIVRNQADIVIGGHTIVDSFGQQGVSHSRLSGCVLVGEQIMEEILLPLIGAEVHDSNDVQMNASSCMNLYAVAVIKNNKLQFRSERDVVSEDLFFNLDFLYFANCVVVSEEVGYFYYQNEQSISRKYHPERFERTIRFYHLLREKVSGYGLLNRAEHRIERSFLMKIRITIKHIVNAQMSLGEKLEKIHDVLQHDVTRCVLETYPVHTLIPAMRLLTLLMKKQSAWGVYCLMKVREGIGRKGVMKKMLKAAGIGR